MSDRFPLKVQLFGPGWLVEGWPMWAPDGYRKADLEAFTSDDVAWLDDMWASADAGPPRQTVVFGTRNPA